MPRFLHPHPNLPSISGRIQGLSHSCDGCRLTSVLAYPWQLLKLPRARLPAPAAPSPGSLSTVLIFSSPDGYYMLLDPKKAKASQKSVLLSPLIQSSGCLSLSFHYLLHGRSPGAGFTAYASVLGKNDSIPGFTLSWGSFPRVGLMRKRGASPRVQGNLRYWQDDSVGWNLGAGKAWASGKIDFKKPGE